MYVGYWLGTRSSDNRPAPPDPSTEEVVATLAGARGCPARRRALRVYPLPLMTGEYNEQRCTTRRQVTASLGLNLSTSCCVRHMCSHLRSSSSIPSKEPCPLWYMSNIRLLSASLKRTATAHGTRQREHFSKHRQPRRAEPNQLHPCVRLWRQPTCAQTHMPRVSLSLRAHGGGSPLMCTASGGDSTDDGSRNSAEQHAEANRASHNSTPKDEERRRGHCPRSTSRRTSLPVHAHNRKLRASYQVHVEDIHQRFLRRGGASPDVDFLHRAGLDEGVGDVAERAEFSRRRGGRRGEVAGLVPVEMGTKLCGGYEVALHDSR